jgi:apolipoprotein N-acyltransferase
MAPALPRTALIPVPALRWLLAIASGVLTFLAFPGWNYHYLIWFCQVPLLVAAAGLPTMAGFRLGLLAGFVTNFGGFHWITYMLAEFGHLPAPVTWAILALQALTQGLTTAVGAGLWRYCAERGVSPALSAWLALWAGEAAVPMIFPWFMGNAASPELAVIQIADLGGVQLVSGLLFAVNAALAGVVLSLAQGSALPWRFVGTTVLAVLLTLGYGQLRITSVDAQQASADKLRLGLVEGNVGIWEKEARQLAPSERLTTLRHNLLKHQQMTAKLQQEGAELVVWPESSYVPFGSIPVLHSQDDALLAGAGGTVLAFDGKAVRPLAPDRLGLPRDLGLLSSLAWPRGDLWRALDSGKRVITVGPLGAQVTDLPQGVVGIAVVQPPADWQGELPAGYVIGQRGEAFRLPLPPLHAPATGKTQQAAAATLQPLPVGTAALPGLDLTAAASNAEGFVVAVGRDGALVAFDDRGARKLKSPVTSHLWTIAGDSSGPLMLAAGDNGQVLSGDGQLFRTETLGEGALFVAFFGPGSRMYVGGSGGALWTRLPGEAWTPVAGLPKTDWVAGGATWRGTVVLTGRDGQVLVLQGDPAKPKVTALPQESRSLTSVAAVTPFAAPILPRSAARIVPAVTPLPDPALTYPDNVRTDFQTSERDRVTPLRGFDVPVLMGALTQGRPTPSGATHCTDCYNSAVLIGGDGSIDAMTDKAFLLVFGEYIPFGDDFPVLYEWLPEASHFQAGNKTAPLPFKRPGKPDARLGILVCYEDLLPRFARRVAIQDPDVLINLTNDAWFGQTAEPEHHLNLALLRSVEYRRWLVRSTNTGISVFIDAVGRRVAETALTGEETLLREVPLLQGRTVYAQLGDWPLFLLAGGVVTMLFAALRGQPSGPGPASGRKSASRRKKVAKSAA